MGTYITVSAMVLSIAVWWLLQEIQTEKKFVVDLARDGQSVYDFLKNPHNLEQIHPKIRNISQLDIQNHVITFNFAESYGVIDLTFQMKVTIDDQKLVLHYQTISAIADVQVELHIKKSAKVLPGQTSTKPQSPGSSTVDGRLVVIAWRVFSYAISNLLVDVWSKTVLATQDFIQLPGS